MSFLENFVGQHRPIKSNISEPIDFGDEPQSDLNAEEVDEDNATSLPLNYTSQCSPSPVQQLQTKKVTKRKLTASELVAGPMVQFLQSRSQQPSEPVSANKQFLESLLPDLDKLSARRQRECKYKFLGLLNNYLDEQDNEQVLLASSSSLTSVTSPATSLSSYNPQGQNMNIQSCEVNNPWDFVSKE